MISQIYGGGGNPGATYRNDFVELFNDDLVSVNLAGWSLQYASATGTGNLGSNIVGQLPSDVLGPGQYDLIQAATGGANGAAMPTPDNMWTQNLSQSSGKVALVNTSTGLACNGGSTPCSAAQLALIEDLVGYGSANFYEGASAAPTLSPTLAAFRADGGCTETNDSAADFNKAVPQPRNTASPLNACRSNGTIPDPATLALLGLGLAGLGTTRKPK